MPMRSSWRLEAGDAHAHMEDRTRCVDGTTQVRTRPSLAHASRHAMLPATDCAAASAMRLTPTDLSTLVAGRSRQTLPQAARPRRAAAADPLL